MKKKKGKMIIQGQITSTGHYWANIPPDPTQKQRNKEQFKHIVYPIPKEKTTRNCKFSFNIKLGLNSACKISTDNHT